MNWTRAAKIYLGLQAVGFVVGFAYGFLRNYSGGEVLEAPESFDFTVADMSTTVEEDAEILVALKEFFDSNTIDIGHDGFTSWLVDE